MKKISSALIVITIFISSANLIWAKNINQRHSVNNTTHKVALEPTKEVIAHVKGMVCDFCARGLEKVFAKKDEVKKIIVSLKKRTVTIQMKAGKDLTDDEITKLIKGNGIDTEKIERNSKKENKEK